MEVPSVSAIEFNTVVETNKSRLIGELGELEQKFKSIDKIQERLKAIDFNLLEQSSINVVYLVIFVLTVAYQVILGRPSIIMMYFTLLSLWIVVADFRYGTQTPACPITKAFIPYIGINILGLLAYKSLPNKAVGLAILVVLYLISYAIMLMAASVEVAATT